MTDRSLITTGAIGAILAAICYATPLRERVATPEIDPAAEARRGIPQPGTGGQSPTNANAIAAFERKEAEGEKQAAALTSANAEAREAVTRYPKPGRPRRTKRSCELLSPSRALQRRGVPDPAR
jgi:hypothetical protein